MTSLTPFRNICPVTYSRFLSENFMKKVQFRIDENQHDDLLNCLKTLYP
ncbi:DNA distortion polypeptide 1, partial [Salmonella enterica subsp. enterica serovar Enteritidis]|nr:DNA distortion polypeptide 1 [Salmonella enterica subsp. enterica serovar Enteritidis]